MRAGKSKILSKEPDEEQTGLDFCGDRPPVDLDFDLLQMRLVFQERRGPRNYRKAMLIPFHPVMSRRVQPPAQSLRFCTA